MFEYSYAHNFVHIKPDFLPFMKLCERALTKYMNSETYMIHGKESIDIAKLQMKSNVEIRDSLKDIVFHLIPDNIDFGNFDLLHSIWTEKFSNMRIKNIMDGLSRLDLHDKKVLKTRNARDRLLGFIAD